MASLLGDASIAPYPRSMLLFATLSLAIADEPAPWQAIPRVETIESSLELDAVTLDADRHLAGAIAEAWLDTTVGLKRDAPSPTVVVDGWYTPGTQLRFVPTRSTRGPAVVR